MKFTLLELAQKVGGKVLGPSNIEIEGILPPENATFGFLAYIENPKKLHEGEKSKASALLVPEVVQNCVKPAIAVKNPKLALAFLLCLFHPQPTWQEGIDPKAFVHPEAMVGKGTFIGAYAVVEKSANIGENVFIAPTVFVGERAFIGDNCKIYAGAKILKEVRIGRNCMIYEGAVIGSEGFGYAVDESGKPVHIPQIGTVVLEDDVEIGANTTIDRATFGETRIGRGTKIDNLVQIAHNCTIGENCMIAAMTGIAGSVVIGKNTIIGGHAGIKDHVTIGENSIIAAKSGVWGSFPPNSIISGEPARPHKERLKILAAMSKLAKSASASE
jgi:UDP-3-O-[3-hydroxymyristoyl] glucosamine N-acyltransferase